MAFQIQIVGMDTLPKIITQVLIERELYQHTRAEIILRRQEQSRYGDREAASLAAKMMNCTVDVHWKDNDLAESVDCFHGYIENVSARRETSSTSLVLSCVAFSKHTDIVPRYRTFQATTLLDIAEHIAKREPLVRVGQAGDMTKPIDLSVQHAETDFAYLSRMLHAWGVPLATEDKTGKVILGARGTEAKQDFPDVAYGWTQIDFLGGLHALPKVTSGGSTGPTALARGQVAAFQGQLSRLAADYYAIPVHPDVKGTHSETMSQVDTSGYHLKLEGAVLAFAPGEVVTFEGQQHLIHRVHIAGYPQQTTAIQEFWLQPLTLPLSPERRMPQWPSRAVWAHVTANEHDPLQQGRIQVEFEWEHLDPQASGERAWLHTLTPYGGGHGGDKKSAQYSGFYSLPEVGERVLVEFLGDWDSEAVIIGAVRQHPQGTTYNPKQTKRWSTPSGNEVLMHTLAGKDVFQVKTAGKMAFESQMEAGRHSVTINSGGHPDNMIHFEGTNGGARLDIHVQTDMHLQAGNNITLEAKTINLTATEQISLQSEGVGGVRLQADQDGIGIHSLAKGVSIQGQTGISLKAPADKVALEGATGITIQSKSTPVSINGGPNVEINTAPIKDLPPLPPLPPPPPAK